MPTRSVPYVKAAVHLVCLLPKTIPTQMFNGYGDQVAAMYAGMDLKKYY